MTAFAVTASRVAASKTYAKLADDIRRHLADGQAVPCMTHDPELWFADEPHMTNRAKALCYKCPSREACLSHAIRYEEHGVWGATTRQERRMIRSRITVGSGA